MTLVSGAFIALDPQALNQPYGFDWTAYLAEISANELITVSLWRITGRDTALLQSDGSIVTGQLKTQIKLSSPTKGVRYTVTNHVTTNSGVQDERSFYVMGQDG